MTIPYTIQPSAEYKSDFNSLRRVVVDRQVVLPAKPVACPDTLSECHFLFSQVKDEMLAIRAS